MAKKEYQTQNSKRNMDLQKTESIQMYGSLRGRDDPNPVISIAYEPNNAELLKFKAAVRELNEWAVSDAYRIVEQAYINFQETHKAVEQAMTNQKGAHDAMLALNTSFLGLLSMFRLYIDHTETKLKRSDHSSASQEYKSFKEAASQEYDSHFAYRFCWELRNYTQHCGFPIHKLEFSEGYVPGTQDIESKFDALFIQERLIRYHTRWKEKVRNDILAMESRFSIFPIAEQLITSLRVIHQTMMKIYKPRLTAAATIIKEAAEKATEKEPGYPCIFTLPTSARDNQERLRQLTFQRMPMDLIKIVRAL